MLQEVLQKALLKSKGNNIYCPSLIPHLVVEVCQVGTSPSVCYKVSLGPNLELKHSVAAVTCAVASEVTAEHSLLWLSH